MFDVRKRPCLEVVEADDAMPALEERLAQMRAEEACAAGDEGGWHIGPMLSARCRGRVRPDTTQRAHVLSRSELYLVAFVSVVCNRLKVTSVFLTGFEPIHQRTTFEPYWRFAIQYGSPYSVFPYSQ